MFLRYAVIGGGIRYAHLASMLNEEGSSAAGFFHEKAGGEVRLSKDIGRYSVIISGWPMRFPLSESDVTQEEVMQNIEPGSVLLLCGPKFPGEKRWDLQYVNLWSDETLLRENAYITAQGAVASALKRKNIQLNGSKCAVIGYGRIGQSLCEILLGAGGDVSVLSNTESKRKRAEESGAHAFDLSDAAEILKNQHYIFSTPPANVLDDHLLSSINKEALLMDLASPPYGFDLEKAQAMGINACREPGLPDRYCPVSAARVLYHAIRRWERVNRE